MKSIGIVGCGAIAREVLRAVDEGRLPVRVAGVTTRTPANAMPFLTGLAIDVPLLPLNELVERSDLLIEAAGAHTVEPLVREAFAHAKDVMVISIGALLDHAKLLDLARERRCRLILPSGAIAGLDAVKGACAGRVDFVRLVSHKPPRALAGAPFLAANGISLDGLKAPRKLFGGPAREAVRGFPDNLNVSAALSLAGIGPDATTVEIWADPNVERNCHDIEVEGEFGILRVHIENIPSENPKTGRLTALSIIRAIRDEVDYVRVGT